MPEGFLTAHECVVEKTHDLTDLLRMCEEIEPAYGTFDEICAELSGYAVEIRYPGEEDPTVEKTREMIRASNNIYQFTLNTLDLD